MDCIGPSKKESQSDASRVHGSCQGTDCCKSDTFAKPLRLIAVFCPLHGCLACLLGVCAVPRRRSPVGANPTRQSHARSEYCMISQQGALANVAPQWAGTGDSS